MHQVNYKHVQYSSRRALCRLGLFMSSFNSPNPILFRCFPFLYQQDTLEPPANSEGVKEEKQNP